MATDSIKRSDSLSDLRTKLSELGIHGEWDNEPDRVDFEYKGFSCLALRNHMGAWCGYAAVPPSHPLHGISSHNVDLEAHGGLTYSGECAGEICHVPKPGEPDNVWWFGFDCGHGWDYIPQMEMVEKLYGFDRFPRPRQQYRNLKYITNEIHELVDQLAKV